MFFVSSTQMAEAIFIICETEMYFHQNTELEFALWLKAFLIAYTSYRIASVATQTRLTMNMSEYIQQVFSLVQVFFSSHNYYSPDVKCVRNLEHAAAEVAFCILFFVQVLFSRYFFSSLNSCLSRFHLCTPIVMLFLLKNCWVSLFTIGSWP